MTAAILLLALLHQQPRPPDRWFGEDKLQHSSISFVATTLSVSAARLAGLDRTESARAGAGLVASAGVLKEISDARRGGPFSLRDLVWDLGGIAGALAWLSLTR